MTTPTLFIFYKVERNRPFCTVSYIHHKPGMASRELKVSFKYEDEEEAWCYGTALDQIKNIIFNLVPAGSYPLIFFPSSKIAKNILLDPDLQETLHLLTNRQDGAEFAHYSPKTFASKGEAYIWKLIEKMPVQSPVSI